MTTAEPTDRLPSAAVERDRLTAERNAAIAEHREQNNVRGWRAYYDRCRPYRSAIVLRVNMERSQQQHQQQKQATP